MLSFQQISSSKTNICMQIPPRDSVPICQMEQTSIPTHFLDEILGNSKLNRTIRFQNEYPRAGYKLNLSS